METQLLSFDRAYSEKPWRPGYVDCCLRLSAWAIWLGHSDPAEHLRGAYHDEEGFRAIIAAAGGVVPVVEECVGKINGKRLQNPMPGCVGVIGSPSNIHRQFGAIHDGESWTVRLITGVHRMIAAPLAIWSI